MGLPSGVQWASCNVGAARPSDIGLYFSWGNIDGHRLDEGYDFSPNVYNSTPAAAINTDLSLNQDAARVNLDAPWRMPSASEFQELCDNCTHVWTTLNGLDGLLFRSNINGNTIFFPAAGYYNGTSLKFRNLSGYYWSTSYSDAENARGLAFNSSDLYPQGTYKRNFGFAVRAVIQL